MANGSEMLFYDDDELVEINLDFDKMIVKHTHLNVEERLTLARELRENPDEVARIAVLMADKIETINDISGPFTADQLLRIKTDNPVKTFATLAARMISNARVSEAEEKKSD